MKLIGFLLCLVSVAAAQASAGVPNSEEDRIRTVFPWLYVLAYPGAVPQVPIRRPQDETSSSINSAIINQPQSDETSNVQQSSNLVREQFLQGVLQGLQHPGSGASAPTISPTLLADFIAQAQATTTTRKPVVEKDINGPDNDEDYDYIDFKNGSRIKYDLDDIEQPVNKILQQTTRRPAPARTQSPATVLYYRPPPRYVYYRPIYRPSTYYYRGG
ncbi:uncharacterized protein LOC108109015 [Drosophila eugracilis]|uniref:uncharacterized protein LOC108109015 n=1 Tax=Drosophila eugracilis TaxID=29029 RepID=UPI0007E808E6|nr:uncharacterized protein LOC108109015 [Drosophila eugracilis]